MRISPENQHAVFHKKLGFREHQFWRSSMMTLSSFRTKFWSCRGKLIKIKQNDKQFVKISLKGLKITLACWIWIIWTMLAIVAFVGHLLRFLSPEIWPPNVELSFCQVYCSCQNVSCIAAVSEELILCQKNWFCDIGVKRISQVCCLHHLKNVEKNCKTQLWDEKQNRALFLGRPVCSLYVVCICSFDQRNNG